MAERLLIAACILVASLSPGAAQAVSVAVVGVHGNGDQEPDALRQMTEDMVAGFKTAGMEVIHGEELRNRLFGAQDALIEKVYLEPVRGAFDEGRLLYEKAQPDLAIEALSRAESALDGVEQFVRDPRLSVDTQLYLGLCHISLGAEDDARQAFSEVVRMDPNRILDTLEYPPRIVELFESVRTEVLSREGATLSVQGNSTGARVYLDGRIVGTTPLETEQLPPGLHTVLVDGAAAGRWYDEFMLGSGERVEVDATLAPPTLGTADDELVGPRSPLTRRLYRELAIAAGTDIVALAAFDGEGDFVMALYSGRSGTFSVSATASLAAAPGARSAFIRQLVERVAIYADSTGVIKEERVATEAIALRLGGNVVLNEYLFGTEELAVTEASTPRTPEGDGRVRPKPNKAAGVVVAILAGALGAAGASIAIVAGVQGQEDPGGVLVITLP